jgi:2-haloacid dehalogenase
VRFDRFPFFSLFEGIVISGLEGMAKPDREIFELLCHRFGLESRTTLFIDDTIANVQAATALGMATVHYESSAGLRDRLVELDLLSGGS